MADTEIKRSLRIKSFNFISYIKSSREVLLGLIIIVAFILLSLFLPNFFSKSNLLSILMGISLSTIIVIGVTVVMVSGMVDLSVGSIYACAAYAVAIPMRQGLPIWLAILIGLATALAWGSLNGFLISKIKVNFLIATLSTMFMARGVVYILSSGRVVSGFPKSFLTFGQGSFLGISSLIWIAIISIPIADLLLHEIVSIRQFYRLGGNETSARLAGITVDRLKWAAFITSGLLAGLAGILSISRFGAAMALMGEGEELQAITACVIGGCTLRGGKGSAIGSFLGLIFLALVKDAMVLMYISVFYQRFIMGAILAIVVSIDQLTRRKQES
ncbi:MAG: ABC transporter permease [Actinobacteria bacterium]|nr:ABC transporter permease [Actinomycetota bacterium]